MVNPNPKPPPLPSHSRTHAVGPFAGIWYAYRNWSVAYSETQVPLWVSPEGRDDSASSHTYLAGSNVMLGGTLDRGPGDLHSTPLGKSNLSVADDVHHVEMCTPISFHPIMAGPSKHVPSPNLPLNSLVRSPAFTLFDRLTLKQVLAVVGGAALCSALPHSPVPCSHLSNGSHLCRSWHWGAPASCSASSRMVTTSCELWV